MHNKSRCTESKKEAQRQFLRLCFQFAKRSDKVIVIYVRDERTGKAVEKCLFILEECEIQNARIHHHCFVGGEQENRDWSSTLPSCYFSISSLSLEDRRTKALLSVLKTPVRLMIETDAPYLVAEPVSVYDIAKGLADYFNMTTSQLIRVCNRNAAKLYHLPW